MIILKKVKEVMNDKKGITNLELIVMLFTILILVMIIVLTTKGLNLKSKNSKDNIISNNEIVLQQDIPNEEVSNEEIQSENIEKKDEVVGTTSFSKNTKEVLIDLGIGMVIASESSKIISKISEKRKSKYDDDYHDKDDE